MSRELDQSLMNSSFASTMNDTQQQIFNYKQEEQKKLIDFEELKKEYTSMTEYSLPFTSQHVEDVVFVGNRRMITLEYIFYDGQVDENGHTKYTKLKKTPKHEYIEDGKDAGMMQTFKELTDFRLPKATFLESKMQNQDGRQRNEIVDEDKDNKEGVRSNKFMRIVEEEN